MRTLRVNTSSPYDIFIGKGILSSCGEEIKKLSQATKIAVISDSNVGKIYSAEVLSSLNKAGYETCYFEFKAGEENKTLATVSQMLTFLAQNGLTRKDLVGSFFPLPPAEQYILSVISAAFSTHGPAESGPKESAAVQSRSGTAQWEPHWRGLPPQPAGLRRRHA